MVALSARRRTLLAYVAGARTRRARGKAAGLVRLRRELINGLVAKKKKKTRAPPRPQRDGEDEREDEREDLREDDDEDDEEEQDDEKDDEEQDDEEDDEEDEEDHHNDDEEDEDEDAPERADTQLVAHYRADKDVLLVGEGNLSFAAALLELWGGRAPQLTATVLDAADVLARKYAEALANAQRLNDGGARVLHGVDATQLDKNKKLAGRTFDTVAFHFPHVGAGIKDQDRNVATNRDMLAGFFASARTVLRPHGLVHVTVRRGMPYDLWKVPFLARACGLELVNAIRFDPRAFPGYAHRRTIGAVEGLSATDNEEILGKRCVTYIFGVAETVAQARELLARKRRKAVAAAGGGGGRRAQARVRRANRTKPNEGGAGGADD